MLFTLFFFLQSPSGTAGSFDGKSNSGLWQSFEAVPHPMGVITAWRVEESVPVMSYLVERSLEGERFFEIIAEIQAVPSASDEHQIYTFLDELNFSGKYVYRVRMLLEDGRDCLSPSKEVKVCRMTQIHWNRLEHLATLFFEGVYGELSVLETNGRVLATYPVSGQEAIIDLSELDLLDTDIVLQLAVEGYPLYAREFPW